jgi:hypothetical protein
MTKVQKINVLLDSNIYLSDYLFSKPEFEGLKHYLRTMKSLLLIPEIIDAEVRKNLNEISIDESTRIDSLISNRLGLIKNAPTSEEISKTVIEQYDKFLQATPRKQLSHKEIDIEVLVTKAVNERKPFQSKSRGFKDAVIWETILAQLKSDSNERIALITNNHKDFGSNLLHEELMSELEQQNASNRVLYYHSIAEFLTAHAESISFINDSYITSHIDDYIDAMSGEIHESELELDVSTHQFHWEVNEYDFSEYVIEGYYIFDEDDESIRLAVEVTLLFDVEVEGMADEYDYDPDGGFSYRHNVKDNVTGFYNTEIILDIDKTDTNSVSVSE